MSNFRRDESHEHFLSSLTWPHPFLLGSQAKNGDLELVFVGSSPTARVVFFLFLFSICRVISPLKRKSLCIMCTGNSFRVVWVGEKKIPPPPQLPKIFY